MDKKNIFFEQFENLLKEMSEIAEESGFDNYWFYNEVLNGDYLVKTFFEEYFRKNEGYQCCADKAGHVLKMIKLMIEKREDVNLQETYGEYQDRRRIYWYNY